VSPDAQGHSPIIVAGPLRSASGLGEGARTCHDAMKKAGVPVYGIDLSRTLLYEHDYPDFQFEDGSNLLGAGTIFLHVGGPFVPLALVRLGSKLVKGKRIVAHWVWELPQLPDDWRIGVPFVHEIWAPSHFAADAIRTIAGDRPVHVLPHPIDAPRGWPKPRISSDQRPFTALVILNIASSFERKNPCAAIRAFRQAFGDDPNARLIVKYANAFSFPKAVQLMMEEANGATNVTFIGDTMDAAGIDSLYGEADVVMSLHRAEGFGLVIAEGMLRGIPVIATDWSGNTDFLTPETGVPVSYSLIPANDPQNTYNHPSMRWADVDTDQAARVLRTLRANPDLRLALGNEARARATALLSPLTYGERAKELLSIS
jgi:glycosyltransferase involved in cell wall biosynthesis